MPQGRRTSEWKLAAGSVAAGALLIIGGVVLAVYGFGAAGVSGIASGALLCAGASVGYSQSRGHVKANAAATFRHRQL